MERGETRDEQIRGEIVRVVCFEPMQRLIIVYIARIIPISSNLPVYTDLSKRTPSPQIKSNRDIFL